MMFKILVGVITGLELDLHCSYGNNLTVIYTWI